MEFINEKKGGDYSTQENTDVWIRTYPNGEYQVAISQDENVEKETYIIVKNEEKTIIKDIVEKIGEENSEKKEEDILKEVTELEIEETTSEENPQSETSPEIINQQPIKPGTETTEPEVSSEPVESSESESPNTSTQPVKPGTTIETEPIIPSEPFKPGTTVETT